MLPLGVVIRLLSHCKTFASTRQGGAKKRATRRGKRVAKGGYIDLSVRREFGGRSAVGVLRLALATGTSGLEEGGSLLIPSRAPRAGFPRGPWGKGPELALGPDRRFGFGRVGIIKSISRANQMAHCREDHNVLEWRDLRDEPILAARSTDAAHFAKPVGSV